MFSPPPKIQFCFTADLLMTARQIPTSWDSR